jgi:sensor histidine kinase YesM
MPAACLSIVTATSSKDGSALYPCASGSFLSVLTISASTLNKISAYLAAMRSKLPIKSLVIMNCVVAGIVGGFLFVLESLYDDVNQPIAFFSLWVIVDFLAIGFINIIILKVVYSSGMDGKAKIKRLQWYLTGYILSSLFFLIPTPLTTSIATSHSKTGVLKVFEIAARGFCVNTLTIFMQTFILIQFEKSKAVLEVSRLKIANMEAAILLLKQQVQPHFLFNALSVLKTLYKRDNQAGEAYLVHLANFLRVSVSYSNKNITKLSDEIDFCMGYLKMQQIRFGTALLCNIDIPQKTLCAGFVPSFSIQPLLENAIKHNEVTNESPLTIHIALDGEYVVVKNNLQLKQNRDPYSGKGLSNLIERYKILSGDDVVIRSDDHSFSVAIKILKS